MIIKIGLKFKHNRQTWAVTGFREGLPLITCKETGQAQQVTDEDLIRLVEACKS